jgi:hypothetical protein
MHLPHRHFPAIFQLYSTSINTRVSCHVHQVCLVLENLSPQSVASFLSFPATADSIATSPHTLLQNTSNRASNLPNTSDLLDAPPSDALQSVRVFLSGRGGVAASASGQGAEVRDVVSELRVAVESQQQVHSACIVF